MENDETTRQNVQAFLQRLSTIPHATSIDPAEATKLAFLFLRARKFDVNRAIELYKAYRHMRYSQQLEHIDPLDEGVRRELLSEKFTVLPHSDPSEPTVFVFSVRRHWPPNSTDRDVLKGILYQLDAALLDERTQIQGITVIYDMTDAKYSNFDADLSLKLLNLLVVSLPFPAAVVVFKLLCSHEGLMVNPVSIATGRTSAASASRSVLATETNLSQDD
ncbi:hypothetical protein AAHC03_024239 [Spirometra sp. Aus1]